MSQMATNVYNLHEFVDFAGRVSLYQGASMGGVAWVDWMSRGIGGEIGVEVYHRL